jgi:class 3 adenylate cyclase
MSDADRMRGQIHPIRGGKDGFPPPEGPVRRIAAILAADISGYSRLMQRDEEGTYARVMRQRRELIEPSITEHHGKLINYAGDGFLAMFDSPVEAVRCAIVIRQGMVARNALLPREQWILYRIGVHLGDVIVEPDGIFGDGVNIAARLEGIATPGDLFISGGVHEQIKNSVRLSSAGRPPSQEHYRSGNCLSRATGPCSPKPGKKASLARWAASCFGYRSVRDPGWMVPLAFGP